MMKLEHTTHKVVVIVPSGEVFMMKLEHTTHEAAIQTSSGGFQRGKRRSNNNRGYYSNRGSSQPARGAYNSQFYNNRGSTQSIRGAYDSSQSNLHNQSHNLKSTRRLNPVNYNGEISLCSVCGSKFHWARNCPDNLDAYGIFTEC